MPLALWIATGVLTALYLAAGIMKALRPRTQLATSLPWVEDYSTGTVKFIGIVEFLGALGLVLPWLTGIVPALTPIAATGLAIVQLFAIFVHMRRGEQKALPFNVVLLLGALFIAIFRFAAL
jgi:uncharacterized membrane protein